MSSCSGGAMAKLKILTFNWHEAYHCLLAKTGHDFTVVDKIKGGHSGWLHGTRPVPDNLDLLPVGSEQAAAARARQGEFDLIICHNLGDLITVAGIRVPKIAVFHNLLTTEIKITQGAGRSCPQKDAYIAQFCAAIDGGTQVVFISELKQSDVAGENGITGKIILPGIDLAEYGGYHGDVRRILRVGNFFTGRDVMLGQSIAAPATNRLPVTVLGINPEIPGARLSNSWNDLKEHFRSHRVYFNTTVHPYEDGYNLSMLEAMATGMPVVSLINPTCPIESGANGFVAEHADELREQLLRLLDDPDLARRLGAMARETVEARFPLDRFVNAWNETFESSLRNSIVHRSAAEPIPRREPLYTLPPSLIELMSRGAWAQARPLLEKEAINHPASAEVFKNLGIAYQHLGRHAEATGAFWTAARLDQNDFEIKRLHLETFSVSISTHPEFNVEAAALYCICRGKGIDVGCGPCKTHPDSIGIDLTPSGTVATEGGVKGTRSSADLCASGDDLPMFKDGELDYVISRHNLEHYQDPIKALEEWKRILKPGGILGAVLPDDTKMDSIHMDETHKHVFTRDSFCRIMRLLGGFDLIYVGECLFNWSFTAVFQKAGGAPERFDYLTARRHEAAVRCGQEAAEKEQRGEPSAALEIRREAAALAPDSVADRYAEARLLRRLGLMEDSELKIAEIREQFPYATDYHCWHPAVFGDSAAEAPEQILSRDEIRSHAKALMTTRSAGASGDPAIEAKLGRARILLSAGKLEEADALLDGWDAEGNQRVYKQLGLGCLALAEGKWENAERQFRASLQLMPEEPRSLAGLGLALSCLGRDAEALAALKSSFLLSPAAILLLSTLLRASRGSGRYASGLQAVKSALSFEPLNPDLLFACAVLSARTGEHREALKFLDRLEGIQPAFPNLNRWRKEWEALASALPA
jgi:tetratricopeptide (TPR) repeat protein